MRITEIVESLETIRSEHGDIEVVAYAYGDIDHHPAAPCANRNRVGPFVLIKDGYQ
ncbi:hypothetical protein ABZ930_36900 [Streptomyces sp. NPDC046716]|uniref:hypothetical protein n=1 Tax=Streptomyces sp. NPDC046716 TaxID=3157093 RepID=UPI0033ED4D8A